MKPTHTTRALLAAADDLVTALAPLRFAEPVTHVYQPLVYARPMVERYVLRYGRGPKRVVLMGMNPGPWGMAQTGVPFGEVAAVRDFLGLQGEIGSPPVGDLHPRRPIEGLACNRSEVSGRRLWGLFAERFGTAEAFFAEHYLANYCPLVFMEASGRNFTPDKLSAAEREPLEAACDRHLARVLETLDPKHVVGVGRFAEARARRVVEALPGSSSNAKPCVSTVLHPSPASPAANRDWAGTATRQLVAAGVWPTQPA